jgi:hypothetical protein
MKKYIILLVLLILSINSFSQDIGPNRIVATQSDMNSGYAKMTGVCEGHPKTWQAYKYPKIYRGAKVGLDDFFVFADAEYMVQRWFQKDGNVELTWSQKLKVTDDCQIWMQVDVRCGSWQTLVYQCEVIDITFNHLPSVCETDGKIYLPNYSNISGATYEGLGVSGDYFDPSVAGPGSHVITLKAWDERIVTNIVVSEKINITNTLPNEVYNTSERINLKNHFSSSDGSFTAVGPNGIITLQSGIYLDPADIVTVGSNESDKNVTINYTHINGECTTSVSEVITIKNNKSNITFNDIPNQCNTGSELDLTQFVSPAGGSFNGGGLSIEGGKYLQLNRTGTFKITYTISQNNHDFNVSKFVRVNELPDVIFNNIPDVCVNEPIDLMTYVQPKNGNFSGPGVTGNQFSPGSVGIGNHLIKYSFTDGNNCTTEITEYIEVKSLYSSNTKWKTINPICVNADKIFLPDLVDNCPTDAAFSGSGVSGKYFIPGSAGVGIKTIKLSYGGTGCKINKSTYIEVKDQPTFTFNDLPEICNEGETVNLKSYVTVKTGTFSGSGVSGNTFNSSIAGVGIHQITYNLVVDGCTRTETKNIEVKAQLPASLKFNSLPNLCEQSNILDLDNYVSHPGGTYSGRGVVANTFDPSIAGANTHQIKYTYEVNGCRKELIQTISVTSETAVDFYNIPTICTKDEINLMDRVSHPGGSFHGTGVNGSKFNPETAGIGDHVITYTYTNGLGCKTVVTKTIKVQMLMDSNVSFNSLPTKCINSPALYLRDYINATDGSFSGKGINGDYFNPGISGVGTFTVTWSKENGQCKQEVTQPITINNEPAITFSPIASICEGNTEINLNTYVNKLGGNFSGPGVSGNRFIADVAGRGSHTITYTYTEGDCETTVTQTINVNGLLSPNLLFNTIDDVCVEASKITLSNYVNVSGGVFKGSGVTGDFFDPATAGPGIHQITYQIQDGLCKKSITQTINVINSSAIVFSNVPTICNSSLVNLNNFVNVVGGNFSGPGVVNNNFDPTKAGVGTHTIFYEYRNSNGCVTSINKTVTVGQLIAPTSWKPIDAICGNSVKIYLPDYIQGQPGGTFSGRNVTGQYFEPDVSDPGIYSIKYTLKSGVCNEEFTTTVQVKPVPTIEFSEVPDICYKEKVNLNDYVNITGGTFTGKGVENGNIFDPSKADRGTHLITYTYRNSNGCESIVKRTINVVDLLDNIEFKELPASCISGGSVNLRPYLTGTTFGQFRGAGVVGDVFNPGAAGEGMHTITYTLRNGTCFVELTKTIVVHPSSNGQWFDIKPICFNKPVVLNRYVNISGGVFTGTGVTKVGNDYIFNPGTAGIGNHIIKYSYTDGNGCDVQLDYTIKVDDLIAENATWNALPVVCESSGTLFLPDYLADAIGTGTFSGRGVTGKYFNPSIAGAGTHAISFTITRGACTLTLETTITVEGSNRIIFNKIPDICTDAPINLNDYVSPQGGSFSGSGIDPNNAHIFLPSVAGIGEFTLTYDYTNDKGCTSQATKIIKVTSLLSDNIVFELGSANTYCANVSSVNLRPFVNTIEGKFKGPGVTGDFFSPNTAGVGIHKILFYVESEGCILERYAYINVDGGTEGVFNKMADICTDQVINLMELVNPKTGVFSGRGVSGNTFDPSIAGSGKHQITYTLTNTIGCKSNYTQTFDVVNTLNPNIEFTQLPDICVNGEALKLSNHVTNVVFNPHNDNDGVFSGKGVDGEYFNPNIAGKGTHTITYTIGQSDCKQQFTRIINVKGVDNLAFNDLPVICNDASIELSNYVAYTGGIFSGPGVNNNTFDPKLAGIGNHVISYTYNDNNGCLFTTQKTIEINSLLPGNIVFNATGEYCQNSPSINLLESINVNDDQVEFKGTGVDENYFNPSNVSPGSYTVTAVVGNGYCSSTYKSVITVNRSENVVINPVNDVCYSEDIDLNNYVSHKGGQWVNPHMQGSIFKTNEAGIGEHVINYIYNNTGCPTNVQTTINIVESLPKSIKFDVLPDICQDNTPIKLSNYITPASDGKFTGDGVEGEYFNPAKVEPGAYTIVYTIGSNKVCKKEYNQVIVVHAPQTITLNKIPTSCSNDQVNLFNYVSHKTGTFSGPGVVNNVFKTAIAGPGSHLIVYDYKGHNGCTQKLTQTVTVPKIYPEVTFKRIPECCQNGNTIALNDYVDFAGGTFEGNGVEGNIFNPSAAGAGTHLISYKLGNEECFRTVTQLVTVISVSEVQFNDIPDICFTGRIDLLKYVSEKGVFTGSGVNGDTFDPLEAGVGTHTIKFHYSNMGCTKTITKNVNVYSLMDPMISFFSLPELCVNDQAIDLSVYTNSNGSFTGNGVDGNIFDPAVAGMGTHKILFSVGNETCKKQLTQFITVFGTTQLKQINNTVICNGEELDLNKVVNVTGGKFEGVNVIGNTFYPVREGDFKVTYNYENRTGCVSTLDIVVSVGGLHPKDIVFNEIDPVCEASAPIDLRKYVTYYSENVTFEGEGITGYFFDPASVTSGVYLITYKVGHNDCETILKRAIQVNELTTFNFIVPSTICKDTYIDLKAVSTQNNATFEGSGVINNVFSAASANIGVHTITGTYINENGCETQLKKTIEVVALNQSDVEFTQINDVCQSDSRVDLRDYINVSSNVRFEGTGVQSYYFDPAIAGYGTHEIICKVGLNTKCIDTYKQYINVLPLPDLKFNELPEVCFNKKINLFDYVNNKYGEFAGKGIDNGIFNPVVAGLGTHTISYQLANEKGCKVTKEQVITVKSLFPENVEFSAIDPMCVTSASVFLNNYVNHFAGSFKGSGVSGVNFDPSLAGVGTHEVTYLMGTGQCQTEFKQYITVLPAVEVNFADLPVICQDQIIDLNLYVSRPGGTFTGNGVNGNLLNTEPLTEGVYTIEYTYKDQNNCTTTVEQSLTIQNKDLGGVIVDFKPFDDVCISSAPIDLLEYVNYKKGEFKGSGITGKIFDPSKAGTGVHLITYTVGNGTCSIEVQQEIVVKDSPVIEIHSLPSLCHENDEIELMNYVSHKGGKFEGQGIENGILKRSLLTPGIFNIKYNYETGNGCTVEITTNITINEALPDEVSFNNPGNICLNAGRVNLFDQVNTDGRFSGVGINQDGLFDPTIADIGEHRITFTYGNDECENTLYQYITVTAPEQVEFNDLGDICSKQIIDLSNYVNIKGGKFAGRGVTDNSFNPVEAGEGLHTLTYTYQDENGCSTVLSQKVDIKESNLNGVIIDFKAIENICISSAPIILSEYVNDDSGTFSGNGVTGKIFDPSQAGIGVHLIKYVTGNGVCSIEAQQEIVVKDSPTIKFHTLPTLCHENDEIELINYVSHKGGKFDGQGIENGILKRSLLTPGIYNIKYQYMTVNNCMVEISTNVSITDALPDQVTFNNPGNICLNAGRVNMFEYTNADGVFSGAGVNEDGLFNPTVAGVGEHRITFTYGNGECQGTMHQYIDVTAVKDVEFYEVSNICSKSIINLNDYVNYKGGTFAGKGVIDNTFNPVDAGDGLHTVTYTYQDNNGCTVKLERVLDINIKNMIDVDIDFKPFENICNSSAPIILSEYVNDDNGVFSGSGVTGKIFDPVKAGIGVHLITYTVGNGVCSIKASQEIVVKDSPVIEFHSLPALCRENDEIQLMNYVSHKGGQFEGQGVENNILKRSLLTPGIYNIKYNYETVNGCMVEISTNVNVGQALPDEVTFNNPGYICLNGGRINMFEFVNTDGKFSGAGINEDGLFDPAEAGAGEHRITFTYGNDNCEAVAYQYINVTTSKNVQFYEIGKVCSKDKIELKEHVNFKGGVFTGRGVANGVFDPAVAGEGVHSVTYTYQEENCTIKLTRTIEVLTVGQITINVDRSAVSSSALVRFYAEGVDIDTYTWTFGDGGYSYENEPFHYYYHTGDFDVNLKCIDTNGCKHEVNKPAFISVVEYDSNMKSVIKVNDSKANVGIHYEDYKETKTEVKVYPNPFSEKITIVLPGEAGQILLYNTTGRLIHTEAFEAFDVERTINTSDMQPGIYFIKLNDQTFKMIKR